MMNRGAYNRKEASKEEYNMAYETANMIMKKAKEKDSIQNLINFTNKYYKELKIYKTKRG